MKKSNLEKKYNKQIYDILLKRLTLPLIVVVITFSIGVVGLTLIPGEIENGIVNKVSFSEAFYFVLYTATTIGYGEIVHFSYLQQLWVVFTIIFTVISWFYILSTIVGLMTNEYFNSIKEMRRSLIKIKNIEEDIVLFVGYSKTYYRLIKKLMKNNRKIIIVIEDRDLYKRESLRYLRDNNIVFLNIKLVGEDLLEAVNITSNKITDIVLTEEISAKFKLGVLIKSCNSKVNVITTIKNEYEENMMRSLKIENLINGRKYIGEDVFQLLNNQKIAELSEWIHGDLEKSDFKEVSKNPEKKILIVGAGNIVLNILELTKQHEMFELLIIDKDKDLLKEVNNKYEEVKTVCANVLETDLWDEIDMEYFNYAFIGTNDDFINMYLCNIVNEKNKEIEIIVKINKRENEYLLTANNIIKKINLEEIENIDIYNTIDKYEIICYKSILLSKKRAYLNKYSSYVEKNLLSLRIEELEISSNKAKAITNKIKQEEIPFNFLLMDLENIDDGYNNIVPLFIKRTNGTHVLIDIFQENYQEDLTFKIEEGDRILYVAKDAHSKYKFEFLLENENELEYALGKFKKA